MAIAMTSWLIWISIVQYFRNSDYLPGKPKLFGIVDLLIRTLQYSGVFRMLYIR